jgi:outer membrane protein OmpA-like peptidoglycan-associated protein
MKLFIFLILFFFSFPLLGSKKEIGCATFSVLELAFGARGAAMGGAFCGLADDISAIRWNPAGLAQITQNQAQFCHREWFLGIKDEYGGVMFPTYIGVIGGSFLYSSATGIEGWNQNNEREKEFKVWECVFTFAYAKKVGPNLYIGMAVDGLYQNLDPGIAGLLGDKGKAVATNLGVLWRTKRIGIGGSLQNIGTSVRYSYHGNEVLPRTLKIGLSCFPKDNLVGVFDVNVPQFGEVSYHTGIEYWISKEFLCVRTGYRHGILSPEDFAFQDAISIGFGVKAKSFDFPTILRNMELNYAYSSYGDLGITHRLSINWIFGKPKEIKTGNVIVRVFDVETREPLRAIVTTSAGWFQDTTLTLPTDGKAEVRYIPIGQVAVKVEKDFYTVKADTIWLEWGETAELEFPLLYTGPKGVPPEKLVKEGICGRVLLGKVTEEGKIEPLRDGVVHFEGPVRGTAIVDSQGWYKIPDLPPGEYVLTIESAKHDYFPEVIPNVRVEHEKATLLHCTLKKVKTLRLYFERDRAYIHPRDFGTIDTLATFMLKYKENLFEIHGHTDPRPPRRFKNNEELSYARAWAVANYLIKKGIDKERLTVKGLGATKPIAPNDTEEGMALNRRIEIIIKSPKK